MTETRPTLKELEAADDFANRHIGPDEAESIAMLKTLGLSSLDELVEKTVPGKIRADLPDLPEARSEAQVLGKLRELAGRNQPLTSLIGQGYHDCILPPVIQRNLLENPGWYTAYTPYQAEIAQGRLEALINFQQMVIDLTGLALANASMLDEATAAAEAMTLMRRMGKNKSPRCFVAEDMHPQTLAVLETRAKPLGIELDIGDPDSDFEASDYFGVILQYPNTYGSIGDHAKLAERLPRSPERRPREPAEVDASG